MSRSTAELELLIKARNLAGTALEEVTDKLGDVKRGAGDAARGLLGAFEGLGDRLGNAIGMATETLAAGGSFTDALGQVGVYMAGQLAEMFGGHLIEKLAESSFIAAIAGPLGAVGSAIGGVISAAIPIGMALLPALLVAALVGAVVFLINNPKILGEIANVAGSIVSGILAGLAGLAGMILGAIVSAPGAIANVVGGFVGHIVDWFLGIPAKLVDLGSTIVGTIIDGLASFPGRVADVIRRAFESLKIDVGPFHISGKTGVSIDLPNFAQDPRFAGMSPGQHYSGAPGAAAGGWVGVHGPELRLVGERGPEFVIPNHLLGALGGGRTPVEIPLVVDGRELGRVVAEGLFYDTARAAPTASRS